MFRRVVRAAVPLRFRVEVAAARRRLRDRRAGVGFAGVHESADSFPYVLGEYRRKFIDYPGQEHLGPAKRRNQAILAGHLDGVVIRPGETFSVWRLAPRPSQREGYAAAAALKRGELVQEMGGAICLLSTVLYNAALLSGMNIAERWCHSVDSYGENRYFELGRDAAVEYGYRDLRFRNSHAHAVMVRVLVDPEGVSAVVRSPRPRAFEVDFQISPAEPPFDAPPGVFAVSTVRVTTDAAGPVVADDLGVSVYRPPRE